MRLFGLIGNPLTHSFSRKYFSEKFQREGWTDCRYELFPLESINELPKLLEDNSDLAGLNVTIPFKKQVIPFLQLIHLPSGLQACNCIRTGKEGLAGFNTDIIGFERSLKPLMAPEHTDALILGSGGAADAVKFVLDQLQIRYRIISRERKGPDSLCYQDLEKEIMGSHKLIINATPVGSYPSINLYPPIPYEYIGESHLLYDLVYNPAETVFLKKGKERGARVKNGQEMLEIQAEESWRIWNEY